MGRTPAERHQRVKEIFLDAVERRPRDREGFLEAACADDPSIAIEVRRLLEREDASGDSFLETPAAIGLGLIRPAPAARESLPVRDGPLRGWTAYELTELLGRGGMGEVWRARDPRLKRDVAVKVVRRGTAAAAERFQREAEAHARVQHDAVLRIYETGRHGDELYIVMQLVDGPTLSEIRSQSSRDEIVAIVARTAEGIHAAHRQGLAHRDIKPSNILVERGEDGKWRPYVTDFGVAADRETDSLTATGELVGTPHYMAPERALGTADRLDPRADVFSLGATLFEMLTGRRPWEGDSPLELFQAIRTAEPTRLRTLDPTVPPDLDTIVHKALARDPDARYPSAREFADDLRRFLDGEPIAARPATLTYTMLKKGRKHRAAIVAAALAVAVLAGVGLWGLRTRLDTREQSRRAQQLGHRVLELENRLRVAYVAPPHDLSAEKAIVRRELAEMERRWADTDPALRGPVDLALGEAHATLRDHRAALGHLERAWESGYRTPEVAWALGRSLGGLWQTAIQEAERISNSTLRHERRRQLHAELLDPALGHLRWARDRSEDPPALLDALIARYEGRYEEALEAVRGATDRASWQVETRQLEGDIYVELGDSQRDRGRFAEAASSYAAAEAAYHAALEFARSDVLVYEGLCSLAISRLELEALAGGGRQEALFRIGAERCDQAASIDPERDAPPRLQVRLETMEVLWRVARGLDPARTVERAVEAASRALDLDPDAADVLFDVASAHRQHAGFLLDAGRTEEALASFDRAAGTLRRALENGVDPAAAKQLGDVLVAEGRALEGAGGDPVPAWRGAVDAYRQAREGNEELASLALPIGQLLLQIAERAGDPESALREALGEIDEAVALKPDWAAAHEAAARTWSRLAEIGAEPPQSALGAAAAALDRALESRPSLEPARLRLAEILLELGREEEALRAVEALLERAPEHREAAALRERIAAAGAAAAPAPGE